MFPFWTCLKYCKFVFLFEGCGDILKLTDLGNHAKNCLFKPPTELDPKVVHSLYCFYVNKRVKVNEGGIIAYTMLILSCAKALLLQFFLLYMLLNKACNSRNMENLIVYLLL